MLQRIHEQEVVNQEQGEQIRELQEQVVNQEQLEEQLRVLKGIINRLQGNEVKACRSDSQLYNSSFLTTRHNSSVIKEVEFAL